MQFNNVLIEPHYFPCIEYFQVLSNSEHVGLEVSQHFEKQNYSNRCHILSSNGVLHLTVPLHKSSKKAYKEIKIDNSQKWAQKHETAIKSAYGKSPFFEHYGHQILGMVSKKHDYLYDLNLDILSNCLELLEIQLKMSCSEVYEKVPEPGITDLRSAIHPKKPSILENQLPSCTYTQVFGNKFVKNLSIIDLLFCEGPDAGYKLSGK